MPGRAEEMKAEKDRSEARARPEPNLLNYYRFCIGSTTREASDLLPRGFVFRSVRDCEDWAVC